MSSSVAGITTTISNVSGTTYLDGLASGLDTTSIIDQLAEIQSKPIKRLEARKTALQGKLAAYQSINASLGALQLAARDLATPSQFLTRGATVSGYSTGTAPLAASASSEARTGTHQVVVEQLAQAQRVLSGACAVADADAALNAAGDLRINGKTVSLTAGDTLKDLRDKINAAGAGVDADVIQVAEGDARLVLTAQQPGVENSIDLADGTGSNLLQKLGLVSAEASLKHSVAGGASAQSDGVANSALDVAVALGLTIPPAGTVLIAGVSLTLDLGSDSLEDLRDRIAGRESFCNAATHEHPKRFFYKERTQSGSFVLIQFELL
ncbi:MAG: flagellar cap protein FliD N-terminal domain-containing protein, partial [Armatimonadia bacterium]